jgi:hypothetical protein
MSDCFDHWDEGVDDEVEEYLYYAEIERKTKESQFNNAVAAEVKRQLALINKTQSVKPQPQPKTLIVEVNTTPARKGATKLVACKCCGNRFEARVADINRGWGKFCSKTCKAKEQERRTGQYRSYVERELG